MYNIKSGLAQKKKAKNLLKTERRKINMQRRTVKELDRVVTNLQKSDKLEGYAIWVLVAGYVALAIGVILLIRGNPFLV